MPLSRSIVRWLACAALLAALAPAWASMLHFASGAWRTDVCDGGAPRAVHAAQHDCCLGSAEPVLPAPAWRLCASAPPCGPQHLAATTAHADPRYTRALTRAPPGAR